MALLAAVTLELGDYGIIGVMMATMGTVVTALMLANFKGLGRRIDSIEGRIAKVEKCKADQRDSERIEAAVGELRKDKAERTEVFREDILAREQMKELGGQLQSIDARLQADYGIAGLIKQLVNELAKLKGAPGG